MKPFFTLLLAASCLTAVGQYEVGDVGPAGGWIFYVDTDNQFEDWDYLESWKFQIGVFPVWCSGDANLTSPSLGAGKANSEQFGTEWEYSQVSAFELARVFDGGDYHDWYIPSKNEIDEIVNSGIVQNFLGGVIGNTTVSSTANSSCNWLVYNDDNGWGSSVSLGNYYVLPVRQFKNMNDGQICGEGTVWDSMAQTCIVANPSDSNFDGCVQLNDLLDLLSAYGECGDGWALCPNILNDDGAVDVEPSYIECSDYGGDWTFYPQTDGAWNNVTVNWGDGTSELFAVWDTFNPISHDYPNDHAWYTITFTQGTCEQTATLLKSVSVNPNILMPGDYPTAVCAPGTLTFLNASTNVTPDTEFEWTFDDGTISEVLDASNAGALVDHYFAEFNGQCQLEVTLQASNTCSLEEFGFPQSSTIDDIYIWDTDNAIIGASSLELVWPENAVELQNVSEKVCLNNGNTQMRREKWNFNGPYGPEGLSVIDWRPWINSAPITLTFPVSGEYEVSLAIENDCGTTDTTIVIVVNDEIETVWQCGDPLEYQGYDYETVQIGEQCWFAENLRAVSFSNGDLLQSDLDIGEWQSTNSAAYCFYEDDASMEYLNGLLYNGFAVTDDRKLCPLEWKVPSSQDWQTIISIHGLSGLKATPNDVPGWNGDNSTGLSLAPNGLRYDWAYFDDIGTFGGWWTESQPNPNFVDYLHLESSFGALQNDPINYGYSIRCIKDAE